MTEFPRSYDARRALFENQKMYFDEQFLKVMDFSEMDDVPKSCSLPNIVPQSLPNTGPQSLPNMYPKAKSRIGNSSSNILARQVSACPVGETQSPLCGTGSFGHDSSLLVPSSSQGHGRASYNAVPINSQSMMQNHGYQDKRHHAISCCLHAQAPAPCTEYCHLSSSLQLMTTNCSPQMFQSAGSNKLAHPSGTPYLSQTPPGAVQPLTDGSPLRRSHTCRFHRSHRPERLFTPYPILVSQSVQHLPFTSTGDAVTNRRVTTSDTPESYLVPPPTLNKEIFNKVCYPIVTENPYPPLSFPKQELEQPLFSNCWNGTCQTRPTQAVDRHHTSDSALYTSFQQDRSAVKGESIEKHSRLARILDKRSGFPRCHDIQVYRTENSIQTPPLHPSTPTVVQQDAFWTHNGNARSYLSTVPLNRQAEQSSSYCELEEKASVPPTFASYMLSLKMSPVTERFLQMGMSDDTSNAKDATNLKKSDTGMDLKFSNIPDSSLEAVTNDGDVNTEQRRDSSNLVAEAIASLKRQSDHQTTAEGFEMAIYPQNISIPTIPEELSVAHTNTDLLTITEYDRPLLTCSGNMVEEESVEVALRQQYDQLRNPF